MLSRLILACFLLAAVLPVSLLADNRSAPMAFASGTAQEQAPPPLRVAERFGVEPLATLTSASVGARDELEVIRAWNLAGNLPARNGFSRPLPRPRDIRLGTEDLRPFVGEYRGGVLGQSGPARFAWGTEVRVEDAYRLRLHLSDVRLPDTAALWVYGSDGEARGPFGTELVFEGDLLTPSVTGPVIRLEVEFEEAAVSATDDLGFTVDHVVELFALDDSGSPLIDDVQRKAINPGCLVDASCINAGTFPPIADARKAIGALSFQKGAQSFVCTGALLNDQDESTVIPYFLTANHCFDSQASASTLEVVWDVRTTSCGGSVPDSFPASHGATLLASSPQSDFTFLVLNAIPAGRTLLGWDARASSVPAGTVVHRISHPAPFGAPLIQAYSRSTLSNISQPCWNPQRTLLGIMSAGGTYGGSSGAPLMLSTGHVVGQLYGGCGPDPEDGCNYANLEGDGWFGHTFNFISDYLTFEGGGGGDTSPCIPDEFTLCAVGGRFEVTSTSPRSLFPGLAGRVSPVIDADLGGAFHYFAAEKNFHTVVKVALRPSGFYAVSAVALDPLEWTVRIRDTMTGEVKSYTNPEGGLGVPTDAQAFAANP